MAKKLTNQEKWERNLRSARMIRACVNGLITDGIAEDALSRELLEPPAKAKPAVAK